MLIWIVNSSGIIVSKWTVVRTSTFKRLYRAKTNEQKQKIKEIIESLTLLNNPLKLGTKKKNLNYWAVELSSSDRLAYYVDGKELYLLKVCDHKDVYGLD